MRHIYLFTSVVALGAAATHCSSDPDAPPAGTGGSAPTAGTSSGGVMPSNGGASSGGVAPSSGGAAKGGATNGGSPSGGSPSGGSATGGALSGGSPSFGGAAGAPSGGGGAVTSGGKAGGGAAGALSGAGGAGGAGGGGKAGGGAAGKAGGGAAGASGSGGGATATFAAVSTILEKNCGNTCHMPGNGKGHIVLSDSDKGLYARLTTPLPAGTQDCVGGILADPANPSNSILPLVIEKGVSGQFSCTDVPQMPYMCGKGGGNPACLSKGDIATIQAWVAAGAPKG